MFFTDYFSNGTFGPIGSATDGHHTSSDFIPIDSQNHSTTIWPVLSTTGSYGNHSRTSNETERRCEEYFKSKRFIPTNFGHAITIDITIALFFIFVYVILRFLSSYWDFCPFKRNALKFIYGNRDVEVIHTFKRLKTNHPQEYDHWSMNWNFVKKEDWSEEEQERERLHKQNLEKNFRFFYLAFWKIRMDDVLNHIGRDAYHYLQLQQILIFSMFILGCIIVVVSIPINIAINDSITLPLFEATNRSFFISKLFWVHISMAIFITGWMISSNIYMNQDHTEPSRKNTNIILVQDVEIHERAEFHEIVRTRFPTLKLEQTFPMYEYSELSEDFLVFNELKQIVRDIELKILKDSPADVHKSTKTPSNQTNNSLRSLNDNEALEEYKDRLKVQTNELFVKILEARSNPSHAMILKFADENDARTFLNTINNSRICSSNQSSLLELSSRTSTILRQNWNVEFAPDPRDLNWRFITKSWKVTRLKHYATFLILSIAVIFLTTPLIAFGGLRDLFINVKPDFLREFLNREGTTYTMALLAWSLPFIVVWLAYKIPTNLISDRNLNVMTFTLVYLAFMLLVFPSLGLYSFYYISDKSSPITLKLECLFNFVTATWFLHYQIHAIAFNFFEISRLGPLMVYLWNCYRYSSNSYEFSRARNRSRFRFDFPLETGWCILMTGIAFTYSIVCPFSLLAGSLYMFTKHINDRINIYMFYEATDLMTDKMQDKTIDLCHYPCLFMWLQVLFGIYNVNGDEFSATKGFVVVFCTVFYGLYMFLFKKCFFRYISKR